MQMRFRSGRLPSRGASIDSMGVSDITINLEQGGAGDEAVLQLFKKPATRSVQSSHSPLTSSGVYSVNALSSSWKRPFIREDVMCHTDHEALWDISVIQKLTWLPLLINLHVKSNSARNNKACRLSIYSDTVLYALFYYTCHIWSMQFCHLQFLCRIWSENPIVIQRILPNTLHHSIIYTALQTVLKNSPDPKF